MGKFDDVPTIHAERAADWRAWLEVNHATANGVWLMTWRAASGRPVLRYEESVEEALCFGWVDSRGGTVDEARTKLYFAPRRAGSGWARPNKERVERLIAAGRMRPAGLAVIERAKADGTWSLLDAVERLEVPDDLAAALDARPPARAHWDTFPRSVRRAILEWIVQAKRPETRGRRVEETALRSQRNERANEWRGRDPAASRPAPPGTS